MMTIVEYAVGVLLIGLLSMPQTLLIGLVRGAIHRFVRRLPTIVRLALDVTLGVLVYWFVSGSFDIYFDGFFFILKNNLLIIFLP